MQDFRLFVRKLDPGILPGFCCSTPEAPFLLIPPSFE
jgi:hypothetical protein